MAPSKKSIEESLAEISAQLAILLPLPTAIAKLELLVKDLTKENTNLRAELAERDKDIVVLKNQVNNIEQLSRSNNVRIFNLPISEADKFNNFKIAHQAYTTVILPILQGAVEEGDIPDVPPCRELLERAYFLPGLGGKPGSVIVRFINRDYRTLLFIHKKRFQPRETSPPAAANKTRSTTSTSSTSAPLGRYLYPVYEDLTKATFSKMRALSAHSTVSSAWSHNGHIRYKLVDNPAIRHVNNVFEPIDKILA